LNIPADKLSFIQKSLDMGEYDVVVKECATLFEKALRKIFNEAIVSLAFNERQELQECEKKIGKNIKGVNDFSFGELVGLFREAKVLSKWSKHSSRDLGLVSSLDFAPIVNLRNQLTHEGSGCTRYEAELVYNYLRNLLATMGYADLKSPIAIAKSEYVLQSENQVKPEADFGTKGETNKIFTYLPERGLIVNPSDGSRNVSFKVETINKIFNIIYREIMTVSKPALSKQMFKSHVVLTLIPPNNSSMFPETCI